VGLGSHITIYAANSVPKPDKFVNLLIFKRCIKKIRRAAGKFCMDYPTPVWEKIYINLITAQ